MRTSSTKVTILRTFIGRSPDSGSCSGCVEADAAVAADDKERYAALVEEFHELLITGADNAKLEAHYRILMNQLAYSRLVMTSLSQPGRPLQSDRGHHNVIDLIIAKDGDSAERVMRDHVRASRRALMAGIDAMGGL
ncbi:FCD domain-containing protein [Streptomyces sp. NPDC002643]